MSAFVQLLGENYDFSYQDSDNIAAMTIYISDIYKN
jgi:hypothetical protein